MPRLHSMFSRTTLYCNKTDNNYYESIYKTTYPLTPLYKIYFPFWTLMETLMFASRRFITYLTNALIFIHYGHFYSASSSPLLRRDAPDYSNDTVSEFYAEAHRQLQVPLILQSKLDVAGHGGSVVGSMPRVLKVARWNPTLAAMQGSWASPSLVAACSALAC